MEVRRSEMEAAGIYFYQVLGDFGWFLLYNVFSDEYETAIAEVHGPSALDSWVSNTAINQPEIASLSRELQINAFIDSGRRRKLELASIVAALIPQDGRDANRIPEYYLTVIDAVASQARAEVERAGSGDSENQS